MGNDSPSLNNVRGLPILFSFFHMLKYKKVQGYEGVSLQSYRLFVKNFPLLNLQ